MATITMACAVGHSHGTSYRVEVRQQGLALAAVTAIVVAGEQIAVAPLATPPRSSLGQAIDDGVRAALAAIERERAGPGRG